METPEDYELLLAGVLVNASPAIPVYQRPSARRCEQTRQLLANRVDSLTSASDGRYTQRSVVLTRHEALTGYCAIDGQQRFTTWVPPDIMDHRSSELLQRLTDEWAPV